MTDDTALRLQSPLFWSRAAPTYGRVGPQFFDYFGRHLVDFARLPVGARVLDVGSGRGAVLFPAAERVGPGGEVIGIDFAEQMVAKTSAEIVARGVKNAQIRRMDAEQIGFGDASFDAVLCGFGIFFSPHLEQAFAGFRRVLKPDGICAVSTWGPRDERWSWLENRPQANRPGGMATLLSRAGFADVEAAEEQADFTYADEDDWWATAGSNGTRAFLESLPPDALAQAQASAYDKLREMKQPDGIHQLFNVIFTRATNPNT
ncbi:MAG: class I SAM-dependent methyltransferase [Chloroflexia bacterium]